VLGGWSWDGGEDWPDGGWYHCLGGLPELQISENCRPCLLVSLRVLLDAEFQGTIV
jgi:hypothetical protein